MLHSTLTFPLAMSHSPCDIILQSGVHFISPSRQTDQHRGNKSGEMPNLCYQSSIRPHGALVATGTECRPRGPSVVTGSLQATGASWGTQVQTADHVDPSVVTGIVCRLRGPLQGHRYRVQATWIPQWSQVQCAGHVDPSVVT